MRFTCLPLLSTFKRARNSSVLLSEKLSWAAWRLSLHSGTHTKRNCLVQSACWCTALQHGHIAGDTQLTANKHFRTLTGKVLDPHGIALCRQECWHVWNQKLLWFQLQLAKQSMRAGVRVPALKDNWKQRVLIGVRVPMKYLVGKNCSLFCKAYKWVKSFV